jgi:hypothetical protein
MFGGGRGEARGRIAVADVGGNVEVDLSEACGFNFVVA